MKYNKILYIPFLLFLALCGGCTEDIIIDVEDGEQLIGIYGCVTNEYKRHQITISKTGDFYGKGEPEMVTGAEVTITDNDSAAYTLKESEPGIYEMTEPMKGESGHIYTLHVKTHENGQISEFFATDTMMPAIEAIDSMKVLPYTFNNKAYEDFFKVCPYFQTLPGKRTSYVGRIEINGKLVTDTLTECATTRFGLMAGVYFNGPELEILYKDVDFPVGFYTLNAEKDDEKIKVGDEITLSISVVSDGYYRFINDVENSSGSNPFYGSPSNVRSNIKPEKRAIGFFYTCATTKGTTIVTQEAFE